MRLGKTVTIEGQQWVEMFPRGDFQDLLYTMKIPESAKRHSAEEFKCDHSDGVPCLHDKQCVQSPLLVLKKFAFSFKKC